MKFAHFADLHLGYEQYNQIWRAEDFASAFRRSVEIAIAQGIDFAIISGDLFHRSVPNPKTLNDAIEVLKLFKLRNIPVFAVEGNHDKSIREMSAYHLLEGLELLNVLGLRRERIEGDFVTSERVENLYIVKGVFKDLEIIGDKHRTKWQLEKILPYLKGGRCGFGSSPDSKRSGGSGFQHSMGSHDRATSTSEVLCNGPCSPAQRSEGW